MPRITEIKGVGPVLAKACAEHGYTSAEQIAAAVAAELSVVPGISDVRAGPLIAAAKLMLEGPPPPLAVAVDAAAVSEPEPVRRSGKRKKKDKKDKKDKKGKKGKVSKKGKKGKGGGKKARKKKSKKKK